MTEVKMKGMHNPWPNRKERDMAADLYLDLSGAHWAAAEDKERIREVLCNYRHWLLEKVEKND